MKKLNLALVIIFGLNAAVWSIRAISVIVNGEDVLWSVICAICWDISFVLQIIAYRSKRKEE